MEYNKVVRPESTGVLRRWQVQQSPPVNDDDDLPQHSLTQPKSRCVLGKTKKRPRNDYYILQLFTQIPNFA